MLGKAQLRREWKSIKKRSRGWMIAAAAAAAAVFLICLGFRYYDTAYMGTDERFVPLEHAGIWWYRFRLFFSQMLGGDFYLQKNEIIARFGEIEWAGAYMRLFVTLVAFAAGAALSIAGAIFQTVYRNPLASPNMLGATAGVQLGNIYMVTVYSYSAGSLVMLRYKYCYLFTALCVCGVLLLGRLAGDRKKTPAVMQMVMAGSVVSQAISACVTYLMYQLEDEEILLYEQISMGTYLTGDKTNWIIFFTIAAVGLVPMILLRYRFNVMGMEETEAIASGVHPLPYRVAGQICAVLLVTAAMIHCGEAGMISMVIPFVARAAVGADFRRVLAFSGIIGGVLMMICRTVSGFANVRGSQGEVLFDGQGSALVLPVTFFVNICLLPVFVIIISKQRRTFM